MPIENAVGALPFGRYPAGRAMWGAAGGAGLVFGLKPDFMFKNGQPRPWIVFKSDDADATIFPWWAGVAVPALLLGVFV